LFFNYIFFLFFISHRVLREKRYRSSKLDDIKGIGPKRKKALLKAFGGIPGIMEASEEDLYAILKNRKAVEEVRNWIERKGGD